MSRLVPKTRPQATRDEVLAIAAKNVDGIDPQTILDRDGVLIVGVRGYYLKTFGNPFKNDINVYDDAMFIVTRESLASFNWNVDPSNNKKGVATLVPGLYQLVKWMHKGKYAALQIIADVVKRAGMAGLDKGRHGINFHYGGDNDTWSLGCQTAPKVQYWQFQGLVYELMDTLKLDRVKYLLIEQ